MPQGGRREESLLRTDNGIPPARRASVDSAFWENRVSRRELGVSGKYGVVVLTSGRAMVVGFSGSSLGTERITSM
jgi:hypothetical protein